MPCKTYPIPWGMSGTRRQILALIASGFARAFAAPDTSPGRSRQFDIDRLGAAVPSSDVRTISRRYSASAVITLLGVPVFSRSGVGDGYARISECSQSGTVSISFGAGSLPEAAHGLNRLGYIREVAVPGADSAYFAFMTDSKENSVAQARDSLKKGADSVPYTAAQGLSSAGACFSRVDRLNFPARYSWRDAAVLIRMVRNAVEPGLTGSDAADKAAPNQIPFLLAVRQAMQTAERTTRNVFFNGKYFRLTAAPEIDGEMSTRFATRRLVRRDAAVFRLNASIENLHTGNTVPFRVWYERDREDQPPLRFEYAARSFLRLAFEAQNEAGSASEPDAPIQSAA